MVTGDRFKEGEYVFLQNKKARGSDATYTVQAGESMHDISQKTGVRLRDLYTKNAMKMNDQAYAGETLHLQEKRNEPPLTMTYYEYLKTQTKTAQSQNIILNNSEYQVQKSDTLYSIAKKFNTSVEELKQINNLETAELKPGQTIVVTK